MTGHKKSSLKAPKLRHGGKVLADQLALLGCEAVFCVPGESFLPALDGLYDHPQIRTIACRHESGAAIMAEAYGKMTGQPSVCFVTRGPGATNASIGIHIAFQDSTPMVLMIGQVERKFLDREAFQEVDFCTMYRPLAKWTAQVHDAQRIPEYVNRAWHISRSGRPGPAVLVFPEDVLFEMTQVRNINPAHLASPLAFSDAGKQVVNFFKPAIRPLIIVGGGGWTQGCASALASFAENWNIPVVAEFRCQDYIDNRHACYIGDLGISTGPKLAQMVREADRILCIGARLGELPTRKYSLLEAPMPRAQLFHVHPDIGELNSIYRSEVAVNATSESFVNQLPSDIDPLQVCQHDWDEWTKRGRTAYEQHSSMPDWSSSKLNESAICWLSEYLPQDAIIASGSGISSGVLHRYYNYGGAFRTQLAPAAGSMGYSVPAAIAAKLCEPQRKVICIAGDGCFLMTSQELATAAALELDITFIIVNNGILGTIRKHQEVHYPGRVVATDLVNPDFAQYAQSFGGKGYTARSFDEFVEAFKKADAHRGLALIDLQIDRERYIKNLTGQ